MLCPADKDHVLLFCLAIILPGSLCSPHPAAETIINIPNGFPALQSLPTWENENKIHCTQTLLEGDGPKTYWTRELANDELILVRAL